MTEELETQDTSPTINVFNESPNEKKKFFSKEVWREPCFRDTLLIGSSSGILSGLLTFIWTSSPRLTRHASFLGFLIPYAGYGIYCSSKVIKHQREVDMITEQLKERLKEEDDLL